MKAQDSEETRSYHDPLGSRLQTAQKRRKQEEEQYPPVATLYDGFYTHQNILTQEASRVILGAGGIIGTCLGYDASNSTLLSNDGQPLVAIGGEDGARLSAHAAAGWRIKPYLSTSYFRAQDKYVSVDIAFMCWAPEDPAVDAAFEAFSRNIAHRLASGERASLELSQGQLVSVLESKGAWYLTPASKRPSLDPGTVVYKGRRTGTERLTAYALRHRMGCTLLASVFWIGVGAAVFVLIMQLF